MPATDSKPAVLPPLIAHVVYRFDTGGLENGVVNLINQLPAGAYRHAVVALTEVVPAFRQRIRRDDVSFHALHKPPGQGLWLYPQLWRLFRALRPAIVHTRNLAALECQVPAWLAGVPGRLHSEHGRDLADMASSGGRYRWLRRAYHPLVQHYVALSRDLATYLHDEVRVPQQRLTQICNGVDTSAFSPAAGARVPIPGCPFGEPGQYLVGSVGRMQPIKAQTDLARAFIGALTQAPALRDRLRLVLVGDGPLRAEARALLDAAGVGDLAWLPGERTDVANIMRGLDCFVLPSLSEGISNTILEAMSCGLPVVATAVGGSPDLVADGQTGELVAAADVAALADSLVRMASDPGRSAALGRAGRALVERRFSLPGMVGAYRQVYDSLLDPSTTRSRQD